MSDLTNITPPRVPVTDPRTGLISREWYRFFLNLFTITGNGSTVPVTDVVAGTGIGVSLVAGVATITNTMSAGVTSFNTRTGAVTLTSLDVTDALTYTPINKAGDTGIGVLAGTSFNGITGLSSATPGALSGTGVVGTGTDAARSDHQHPVPSSANIKTWLGYTPVNLAGDTMTGALNLNTGATSVVAGVPLNIGTLSPNPYLDFYNLAAPANPSVRIQYDGTINWGSGTFPTDTYIGRYSAGVLLAQNLNLLGGLSAAGDVAGATFTLATKSINFGSKELDLSSTPATNDVVAYNGAKWVSGAITFPVTSVNGEAGAVSLSAADVGAPATDGTGATGTWGIGITGNAGTVTSGVYTTGSYADPAWITSLAKSKVGLGSVENTALSTWPGTTSVTTLGTIGTGTWQGTVIGTTYGGTGRTDGLALGLTGTPNITVGTIGSGAITSTGVSSFASGNIYLDAMNLVGGAGTGVIRGPNGATHMALAIQGSETTKLIALAASGNVLIGSATDLGTWALQVTGSLRTSALVNAVTGFEINGTSVLNSTRDLENIRLAGFQTSTASSAYNTSGTGEYQVLGTAVLNASRQLVNITSATMGDTTITSGIINGNVSKALDVRLDTALTGDVHGIYINRSAAGSAAVTNSYGIKLNTLDYGGSVTNAYGFWMGQTYGSTAWGFYQNGTNNNRFNGNIGIGKTPSTEMDVLGTVTANNAIFNNDALKYALKLGRYNGAGSYCYIQHQGLGTKFVNTANTLDLATLFDTGEFQLHISGSGGGFYIGNAHMWNPSGTAFQMGGALVVASDITANSGFVDSGSGYKVGGTQIVDSSRNADFVTVDSSSTSTDNVFENTIIQKVAGGYGWNDILGMIDTRGGAGSAGAPTLTQFRSSGIYLYAFPYNQTKEVFSNFHIGHDYKSSTVVYPHIHWTVNTTSTGTVRWGIEYTVAKGHQQGTDSDYGATTTVYVNQTISANSQYRHFIAEVAIGDAIAATKLEPDSVILCRFFRDTADAADTFPDDVFAILTDCHYQSERFSTKNKAPNFYS